jgi:hypothetical protein
MAAASNADRNCHIADPASVALSDPTVTINPPIPPPTVLYLPTFPAFVTDYYNSVIQILVTFVKYALLVELEIVA